MQKNAYLDAKIGVDTAENEPRKECCVVAVIRAAIPWDRAYRLPRFDNIGFTRINYAKF